MSDYTPDSTIEYDDETDRVQSDWRDLPTVEKRALLARLRERNRTLAARAGYRAFQQRYFDHPDDFMADCINWPNNGGPTFYQLETAHDLALYRRVGVKGPRRLGKTADAALILLWFALTRDELFDWKAVITAGVGRQVTQYFWPEVHRWARRLRWDIIGREPFNLHDELMLNSMRMKTGLAFGAVSNDPSFIEGVGAPQFLVILDEAKSVSDAVFDTLEAAMVDTEDSTSYALALSTPGKPIGRLYDIFSHKPGLEHWHPKSVTIYDAVKAGRRMQEEVDRLRTMWGENSTTFRCFVLGEFADDGENSIIPLAWVEAAVDRLHAWKTENNIDLDKYMSLDDFIALGVDVGLSHDLTCLAPRYGNIIPKLWYYGREDPETATMITAGRVAAFLNRHQRKGYAVIDTIGIGAGVVHRLKEQKYKIIAFNAGASKSIVNMTDRSGSIGFVNKRAAAWWTLREYFDPTYGENIMIPDDPRLIGDLTAPTYTRTSGGKIKVESKQEIHDRLGRSTDAADAVMQAFWKEPIGIGFG